MALWSANTQGLLSERNIKYKGLSSLNTIKPETSVTLFDAKCLRRILERKGSQEKE